MLLLVGTELDIPVTLVVAAALPPRMCAARLTGYQPDRVELLTEGGLLEVGDRVIVDGGPALRARGQVAAVEGRRVLLEKLHLSGSDARSGARLSGGFDLAWSRAGGAWRRPLGPVRDLSTAGTGFVDRPGWQVGQRILMRVSLGPRGEWRVPGRVARVEAVEGDRVDVGVAFDELPVDALVALAATMAAAG